MQETAILQSLRLDRDVVYEDQGLLEMEEAATVAAHQVAPELDAMKVRRI